MNKIEIKKVELVDTKPEGLNGVRLRVEFLGDGQEMIVIAKVSDELYQDKAALDKALLSACESYLEVKDIPF